MKNLSNRVQLIGMLGRDPELKEFDSGKQKINFTMATNEYYKNDKGDKVETTHWHRVIAWGNTAKYANQYLKKGNRVMIEGKLTSRTYDDKDGVTRNITEVVANDILNLTPKEASSN